MIRHEAVAEELERIPLLRLPQAAQKQPVTLGILKHRSAIVAAIERVINQPPVARAFPWLNRLRVSKREFRTKMDNNTWRHSAIRACPDSSHS